MYGHPRTFTIRRAQLGLIGASLALLTALMFTVLPAQSATVPAPTGVAVAELSTGMKVTWDAPVFSNRTYRREFQSYKIERRVSATTGFETFVADTGSTSRAYTDTTGELSGESAGRFITGRAYMYRIIALYEDSQGQAYESEPSHHGYAIGPAYPGPTNLDRSDSSSGVTLTWDSPDLSWEGGAATHTGLLLRYWDDDGLQLLTLAVGTTSYTDSGGAAWTGYQLKAIYGVFESWERHFSRNNITTATPGGGSGN